MGCRSLFLDAFISSASERSYSNLVLEFCTETSIMNVHSYQFQKELRDVKSLAKSANIDFVSTRVVTVWRTRQCNVSSHVEYLTDYCRSHG